MGASARTRAATEREPLPSLRWPSQTPELLAKVEQFFEGKGALALGVET